MLPSLSTTNSIPVLYWTIVFHCSVRLSSCYSRLHMLRLSSLPHSPRWSRCAKWLQAHLLVRSSSAPKDRTVSYSSHSWHGQCPSVLTCLLYNSNSLFWQYFILGVWDQCNLVLSNRLHQLFPSLIPLIIFFHKTSKQVENFDRFTSFPETGK